MHDNENTGMIYKPTLSHRSYSIPMHSQNFLVLTGIKKDLSRLRSSVLHCFVS